MKQKKSIKIKTTKRKDKRAIKYSKILVSILASVFLVTKGVAKVSDTIEAKRQEKLRIEAMRIEEEKRKEIARLEEEKRKEEEERKKRALIGTNQEGKQYAYDAKEISERLKNYDYSHPEEKMVFLTFDDGPSTSNTPDILDILDEKNVKATFFVTGKMLEEGGERSKDILKRTFESGNAIANHSWSHDYHTLYPSRSLDLNAFVKDFEKTDELLKEVLGENFSTRVIRCPGGYSSWNNMSELDTYLQENDRYAIDWNALNRDAEGKKKSASELVSNAIQTSQGKDIVILLMHDTYGKEETVKALPEIIDYFKGQGYVFKTLA